MKPRPMWPWETAKRYREEEWEDQECLKGDIRKYADLPAWRFKSLDTVPVLVDLGTEFAERFGSWRFTKHVGDEPPPTPIGVR